MKSFTIINSIYAIFIALLISACSSGSDNSGADDTDTTTNTEFVYSLTNNPDAPIIIGHDSGELITVTANPDTDEMTGALWIGPEGEAVHVEFSADGLPEKVSVNGWVIVLGNIRESEGLTDGVIVTPDQEIFRIIDIAFDTTDIRQALSDLDSLRTNPLAFVPTNSQQRDLSPFWHATGQTIQAGARFAGVVLNAGMCVAALVTAGAETMIGGPLTFAAVPFTLTIGCAGITSTILSATAGEDDQATQDIATGLQGTSIISSSINCQQLSPAACADLIATIISEGVDTIEGTYNTEAVTQAVNILRGQGGDIQINLVWDNEADLDLWVTDPFDEKIYYSNPTSASGGRLDLDDVDGYGPENIRWLFGTAPIGLYKVEVHHFSGPAPANFVITILKTRSEATTIRGEILEDEVRSDLITFLYNPN